jgi:hypothetical protein
MATPSPASPDKHHTAESMSEQPLQLIVTQPQKLEGLLETLAVLDRVSERIGEDRSGDMGGGGTGGTQQGDDDTTQSLRELAIANLPDSPIMQRKIAQHIQGEVRKLQKQIRTQTKSVSRPGSAHTINKLYARIRRLNSILAQLLETSYDVLKRLYIRIFVDGQSVI